MDEKSKGDVGLSAALIARGGMEETMRAPRINYHVECHDKDGNLKWEERFSNVVTTEGKNDLLDKYFKGSSYTAAWYVGLIDNASFTAVAAGDTAAAITTGASGANQWGELTEYNEANRQTLTLGTPSGGSVDNSASKAQFTINATITARGAFVASASGKLATSGKLYSAGEFGASRSLVNNDVLSVTATLSQT